MVDSILLIPDLTACVQLHINGELTYIIWQKEFRVKVLVRRKIRLPTDPDLYGDSFISIQKMNLKKALYGANFRSILHTC